jgi:acetyltransferase
MMEETRLYTLLLKGSRDRKPSNILELEKAIVNFSQMIIDFPEIIEVDINPLLATSERTIALDARIVLDKENVKTDHEHLCILPYPVDLNETYVLKDKENVLLRPIKAEDEPLVKELFGTFSDRTIHFRFFHAIKDITHEMLVRYCHIDYDREISIVAEYQGKIMGMSRLMFDPGESKAEFSVVVTDGWQNKGLGLRLVEKIVDVGRKKKLDMVYATVIKDNSAMKHVARKLGFQIEPTEDPQIDKLVLEFKSGG